MQKTFQGVWIPKEIWEDTTITFFEKALLAEINTLDDGNGAYCSNAYLAKMFSTTTQVIANSISKLRKRGYIMDRGFNGRTSRRSVTAYVSIARAMKEEQLKADIKASRQREGSLNVQVKACGSLNADVKAALTGELRQASSTGETEVLGKGIVRRNDKEGFELFWKAYPKKIGRIAAQKAFDRLKGTPPAEALVEAVERHKRSLQWQKDKGQFIPAPTTWLNQGRWEDELPTAEDMSGSDKRLSEWATGGNT